MKFTKLSIILLLVLVSIVDSRRIKKKNSSSAKGEKSRIITISNAVKSDKSKDTFPQKQFFDKAREDKTKTTTLRYDNGEATFEKVVDQIDKYLEPVPFKTDLDSGKLEIKMVELYTRPFLQALSHELIGLCAERADIGPDNTRSYYLLLDRGSVGITDFGTRVSIYVLGALRMPCTQSRNTWPSTGTNGLLKSKEDSNDISSDVKNLKLFLNAVFLYPQVWKKYGALENCQHFATNFYNFLTGENVTPSNYPFAKVEEFNNLFLESESLQGKKIKKLKIPAPVFQSDEDVPKVLDP